MSKKNHTENVSMKLFDDVILPLAGLEGLLDAGSLWESPKYIKEDWDEIKKRVKEIQNNLSEIRRNFLYAL